MKVAEQVPARAFALTTYFCTYMLSGTSSRLIVLRVDSEMTPHARAEVVIIPEFPFFEILPLLMMLMSLAALVYRRKHIEA